MSSALSFVVAIVMLGLLITIHELGHYLSGRALGLPVVEFAIGFGPRIFGFERSGIAYSLRALPLGGYCAFEGEDSVAEGTGNSLNDHPAWKRLIMQVSGAAMNFIAGYLLVIVLLSAIGIPYVSNQIAQVEAGKPAALAGILPGDRVVAVNGQETVTPAELIVGVSGSLTLTVKTGDTLRDVQMQTFYDEENKVNRVGFTMMQDYQKLPLGESIQRGGSACVEMVSSMFTYLRELVSGKQDVGGLVGVVGTVTLISSQAQQGFAYSVKAGIFSMLNMAILITLNLGLMNLLPLPALDGGRIVFSLIEIICRRPVSRKVESIVHGIGFVLLMGLMVFLIFKDVIGLATGTMPF